MFPGIKFVCNKIPGMILFTIQELVGNAQRSVVPFTVQKKCEIGICGMEFTVPRVDKNVRNDILFE
jgi:hypothetical protein